MALQSILFTESSPGRAALKRCSEDHAGHFYRGMVTTPPIGDAITRIQTALRKLSLTVNDPPGVYGRSTEAAVLKFKQGPPAILGPGQTRPDAIVGIQTIHRLDERIGRSAPPPAPLEFGSNAFRFTFFGNKGLTGKGVYSLFIASTQLRDSQNFDLNELSDDGDLIGGFRGETRGTFTTPSRLNATDFGGATCSLSIQKQRQQLNGFLQLNVAATGFIVNLRFEPFREERQLGGSLTSGTLLVRGQIVRHR